MLRPDTHFKSRDRSRQSKMLKVLVFKARHVENPEMLRGRQ